MSIISDMIFQQAVDAGLSLHDKDNWSIRRLYPGHHQRSAGAWSWTLHWNGSMNDHEMLGYSDLIGSCYPAKEVAYGDFELYYRYGYEFIPSR